MNSTEVQNPRCKLYAYHDYFRWLTILAVALMLALHTLSCCCLYKVCWNVSEALVLAVMCLVVFLPVYSLFTQKISWLMLAICVWFCSCLCKACSCMCFRSSLTCFADFLSLSSLTLPQRVRLFNISLQAPQQQYTVLSFSSMRRHSHSHKLTSSRALRYYTVGIPS